VTTKWTPEEIEQMEIDDELDECKASCAHFIQKWVYIEDKDVALGPDAPGVKIKFTLWPLQLKALLAIVSQRLSIIMKARQLGLTWLVLSYAAWRMVFFPGYTVIALSKTEKDAKELVRRIKFILENLPPWMIREKKQARAGWPYPTWEDTTEQITINHPEKGQSLFKSFTSAPSSARSFTANLLIFDEWAFQEWAEKIWASAYPTINRPTGGQCIGLSTNERGSLFERTWKNTVAGLNTFFRIFIPWWADPRRTKEWYEQTKRDLPNSYRQEYPSTPEEAMSAGEGTAFPEFTEQIHVCKPFTIPDWWRKWRSNDPGYADPFCWHWFAVSPDGIVYIYREYTRSDKDPRVTYSDQAREVIKLTGDEKIGDTVAGRDAWNKLGRALDSAGKSIVDCYRDGGMVGCTPPPTDQQRSRIIRKAVMHEYLKPFEEERTGRTIAKLQIFSTCTSLIEAIPNLVVDEKDSEKVSTDPHVYTNPFDCAGYGLVAWEASHSKPPVEPLTGDAARIHKHIESLIKDKKGKSAKRYLA